MLESHAGQPTTSGTLEVKPALSIGQLSRATGVTASALRYWEELGLLAAPARVSGQRRYPPAAVEQVGLILLLRDCGFTLRELRDLMASRDRGFGAWREPYRRKVVELDRRIAAAQVARTALAHALACRDGVFGCERFSTGLAALLAGKPLAEAHAH